MKLTGFASPMRHDIDPAFSEKRTAPLNEIISHYVICRQPGRYIGWPTIAEAVNGDLLVVFSGDRDAHVDPFGKTMLVRSTDNGRTWGEAETVNDTPLDDRDAGICIAADGSVLVSWFTSHYVTDAYMNFCPNGCSPDVRPRWRARIEGVRRADLAQWASTETDGSGRYELGRFIRRSTDHGRTWQPPVRVIPTAPHGPCLLSDSRLCFVGTGPHIGRERGEMYLATAESRDHGQTWRDVGRINASPPYRGCESDGWAYLTEPHVVETSPDCLLMMARYEESPRRSGGCRLWQAVSEDNGETWTEPAETPILGKPPHLIRLRDGRILVTYGYRHAPFGQRACLSADGGRTWDYEHEIVLRDDAPSGDLGYPASLEMKDGTILTVYYQQEHKGEKPCLMATHWKSGS